MEACLSLGDVLLSWGWCEDGRAGSVHSVTYRLLVCVCWREGVRKVVVTAVWKVMEDEAR